ncbi:MAG: di-trans,poly-cis-decaprenylcistransferase [Rhodospirillaceae bacterium]|nr:di-trans,poly-cis-decaprenylcistransferase [Rhodospirillaceae bacterium]
MKSVSSLRDTTPPPPVHVGIIMDGNGRWAQARGLPRIEGHRRGMETVREVVKGSIELGVEYLTLYGFSIENWKRPAAEISSLMGLLRLYLRQEIKELDERRVRMRFIGHRSLLADDIVALIEEAEEQTKENTTLNLVVALSYGARQEITAAAQNIAQRILDKEMDVDAIDENVFSEFLETGGMPDPDLVIRTSGEQRISNFLLWQSAYAELVFTDTLWPDFSREDLRQAVLEFHRRERRYGATG